MMNKRIILVVLVALLSSNHGNSASLAQAIEYYDAFVNMRGLVKWPAPRSTPNQISSTFGPRLKYSSGSRYDWHRGVDISATLGDEILASYNGTVLKAENISGGGLTVILQHAFKNSNVQFHGENVTKWYTHYNHLSVLSVSRNSVVTAGQKIGEAGKTGAADSVHLHHEVRVGTYCSLEWALQNPTSTCNKFNFDPHVHPLLVFPNSTIPFSSFNVTVTQAPTASQDAIVKIVTEDRVPDVNRFTVQLIEPGMFGDEILKEHALDFDLRTGFDASSVTTLDTQDITKPYLAPKQFITLDTQWIMDFVIPKSWVGPKSASQEFVVTVTNIWHDNIETIRFGKGTAWN